MSSERRKLLHLWTAMRARCEKPSDPAWANYGGRGIKVCERWSDFELFRRDMGPRPKGFTLDRRDNDLGYSPDNCRWVDRPTQNANRRYCIVVDDGGEKVVLKEYCRRHGLPYQAMRKRIRLRGWSIAEALSTPPLKNQYGRRNSARKAA